MTHPTEAGERERLATLLNDIAADLDEQEVEGYRSGMYRNNEIRRAANLLRTEPGGEPVAWISESELARLKRHGNAVVQDRKCRHWTYGKVNVPLHLGRYRRGKTMTHPTEAGERESYRNPGPCGRHDVAGCVSCNEQIPVPGTEVGQWEELADAAAHEAFIELLEEV